jgi:broad specificity phosphatase PhoE
MDDKVLKKGSISGSCVSSSTSQHPGRIIYASSTFHQEALELPHSVQLHILRHGETVTNRKNLVTGSKDVQLTALGRVQAKRAGRKLDSHYDCAFSSTLVRSQETLRMALEAGNVQVSRIAMDPRLNERSLGDLELKQAQQIHEFTVGDFSYAPIGGESYFSVLQRVFGFLFDLARFVQQTKAKRIIISSHLGPMRIIAGILNQETDPVSILARNFNNADIIDYHWSRLTWPKLQPSRGMPGFPRVMHTCATGAWIPLTFPGISQLAKIGIHQNKLSPTLGIP